MATCGYCKQPGQTIDHVRACGGVVATAVRPELTIGNVVTLYLEEGYWLVLAVADEAFTGKRVQRDGTGPECTFPLKQVEIVFADANAAVDYDLAVRTQARLRHTREILHGDPNYCRGCAKGQPGAKWHREDCPVIAARQTQGAQAIERFNTVRNPDVWGPVNELRNQVKPHLHRKVRNAQMGHFAVRLDGSDVVKFYRVKLVTGGQWAGKVFVEAQASDDYHPLRSPETLTMVLTAILANPGAAEALYGTELGRCCRCNRTLTDETSRALGIGPECRSKA